MNNFLETYGKAIFTLVIIVILITFAGPLGKTIKTATNIQVKKTDSIGTEEIAKVTNGEENDNNVNRPEKPKTAVDQVYCIYYTDGELVIAQNEIEPENGKTVEKQGFYSYIAACTNQMTTVRFEGAVMPNSCQYWFYDCTKLKEIKNIENLYTDTCTSMFSMFSGCRQLTNIDVSNFVTSNVLSMQSMFSGCSKLTSLDVSNFVTSKVETISGMFADCSALKSLDISKWNIDNVNARMFVFKNCTSLQTKSVKVSQATYDKLIIQYQLGITENEFDIVK